MLTVQGLSARYGVSRQTLYERLRASGVSPIKRGNRSLFDEDMVAVLDAQHQQLKDGFNLRDSVGPTVIDVTPDTGLTVPEPNTLAAFAELLASAISQSSSSPTDDNLTTHRQLQEIADNEWLVSTKVLARCLGMANGSLHGWNQEEQRFGFRFVRQGRGTFRVHRVIENYCQH